MAVVDIFAPVPRAMLSGSRMGFYEDFRRLPGINADIAIAFNQDFEVLGTNAVSADVTAYAEGGITVASHGAATDSTIILPHLDTAQSLWTGVTWGTDQQTQWGCWIRTAASITNCTFWAGLKLTNTPVVATDNDQVFFRYQNGTNTNWQCISSVGNTDTTTDSGVALAVNTNYRLWITIDSSRVARFFIDGALVHTTGALTDATDFKPYIGVLSATDATAKTLYLRDTFISRAIT